MLKKLEKQKKKEEVNTVRFEGGKFCLDIAKIIFAGVIIAGVMKDNPVSVEIYCWGLLAIFFLVLWGFYLINNSKKRKK